MRGMKVGCYHAEAMMLASFFGGARLLQRVIQIKISEFTSSRLVLQFQGHFLACKLRHQVATHDL